MEKYSVPLELLYGSQEYKFFTEVFAVSKVPCVCVIRESKVVEVINEGAGNDEFISRISGALNVQVDTDKSSIESSGTSDNEPMRRNSSDGTEERRKYQADLLKQRKQQQDERKRILELLEKDKQERRSARRYSQHEASSSETSRKRPSFSSSECALAIRLNDGTPLKHHFPSTFTLLQVRDWIDRNRTDGHDEPYAFYQTIPQKKLFEISEEQLPLTDLGLVPSSTLILKPSKIYSRAYTNAKSTNHVEAESLFSSSTSWIQEKSRVLSDAVFSFLGYDENFSDDDDDYNDDEAISSDSEPSTPPDVKPDSSLLGRHDKVTYNGNNVNLQDNK